MAVRDEHQGPAMGLHDELQRGALWPGHGLTRLRGATSRARSYAEQPPGHGAGSRGAVRAAGVGSAGRRRGAARAAGRRDGAGRR